MARLCTTCSSHVPEVFIANDKEICYFRDGNLMQCLNNSPLTLLSEENSVSTTNNPQEGNPYENIMNSMNFLSMSISNTYIALVNRNKYLLLWRRHNLDQFIYIGIKTLAKRCTKLQFTDSEQFIVVADKAGDVWAYDTEGFDKCCPEKPILGHVSIILDMIISKDDKFIITADRDEKIRVSHFPNAYNIMSYCLGHTQFVSALCLHPKNDTVLLSAGGDKTLRVWDFHGGEELLCHPLDVSPSSCDEAEDVVKAIHTTCLSQDIPVAALYFVQSKTVHIYHIPCSPSPAGCSLLHSVSLKHIILDMTWTQSNNLSTLMFLVMRNTRNESGVKQTQELVAYTIDISSNDSGTAVKVFTPASKDDDKYGTLCNIYNNSDYKDIEMCIDERNYYLSFYKASYDNVSEYYKVKDERKLQRDANVKQTTEFKKIKIS